MLYEVITCGLHGPQAHSFEFVLSPDDPNCRGGDQSTADRLPDSQFFRQIQLLVPGFRPTVDLGGHQLVQNDRVDRVV